MQKFLIPARHNNLHTFASIHCTHWTTDIDFPRNRTNNCLGKVKRECLLSLHRKKIAILLPQQNKKNRKNETEMVTEEAYLQVCLMQLRGLPQSIFLSFLLGGKPYKVYLMLVEYGHINPYNHLTNNSSISPIRSVHPSIEPSNDNVSTRDLSHKLIE